uniref:Uncharacterized protein n=1 Tax=Aegilops tauschii TaxID=37682 RepID=M8C0L6_AEGTA
MRWSSQEKQGEDGCCIPRMWTGFGHGADTARSGADVERMLLLCLARTARVWIEASRSLRCLAAGTGAQQRLLPPLPPNNAAARSYAADQSIGR